MKILVSLYLITISMCGSPTSPTQQPDSEGDAITTHEQLARTAPYDRSLALEVTDDS